jgi:hypothetical protein
MELCLHKNAERPDNACDTRGNCREHGRDERPGATGLHFVSPLIPTDMPRIGLCCPALGAGSIKRQV